MTSCRARYITAAIIVVTLMLAFGAGAGVAQESSPKSETGAAGDSKPANPITGVWTGTTVASCSVSLLPDRCNAQQKVSMTVLEGKGSKLTGYYKCAYGTQNCYHMNETGKIVEASMTGQRITMRVQMPDGMSCIYTGRVADEKVKGGYTCYTGGSLLERGTWRAEHSY